MNNNLDILRAFAVLAVFFHHLNHTYRVGVPFFDLHGGWLGVQLFFLLSGYLIIQSAYKYPLKTYLIHRCLRIFPAYWVTFLGAGWLFSGFSVEKTLESFTAFLLNLSLLQHLSINALLSFDSLHVSWTLTIEILWYLLAPLMIPLLRRAPHFSLVASFFLSTAWVYLATHQQLDRLYSTVGEPLTDEARYFFINNAFPAQFCFFVLGAYLYYQRHWLIKLNPLLLTTIFFVVLAGWPKLVHKITNPNFLSGIGLASLFIIALQAPVWNNRILKWISDISYSIYLLHFTVLLVTSSYLKWQGITGALGALAVTMALAHISYLFIEKPAMRLARRF